MCTYIHTQKFSQPSYRPTWWEKSPCPPYTYSHKYVFVCILHIHKSKILAAYIPSSCRISHVLGVSFAKEPYKKNALFQSKNSHSLRTELHCERNIIFSLIWTHMIVYANAYMYAYIKILTAYIPSCMVRDISFSATSKCGQIWPPDT